MSARRACSGDRLGRLDRGARTRCCHEAQQRAERHRPRSAPRGPNHAKSSDGANEPHPDRPSSSLRASAAEANTEPDGSVFDRAPGCILRRTLRRHATWRFGAARAFGCFDFGPRRQVPHDPHGHEEACRRTGACRARHHGEGREGADVPPRPSPTRPKNGLARRLPKALGRALRRIGRRPGRIEAQGEDRWTPRP